MGKITHADIGTELTQGEWEADTTHLDSQGNTLELSRSATLVVAASDSSAKSKAGADYVCDGTDDDVQIQAAIDAGETAGIGFTLVLLPGTYTLSDAVAPITITPLNCSESINLFMYGAKLVYSSGSGVLLTINTNLAASGIWERYRVYILGGALYGSSAAGNAIRLNDVSGAVLRDLYFQTFSSVANAACGCIYMPGSSDTKMAESNTFENILMRHVGRGFVITATGIAAYSYANNSFRDIHIEATSSGALSRGIYAPNGGTLARSLFERVGVWLADDNTTAFEMGGIGDWQGCVFMCPMVEVAATKTATYGFWVGDAVGPTVISPHFSGTVTTKFDCNASTGVSGFYKVIGSQIFATENSDVATNVTLNASGVGVIAHGCTVTPTYANVVCQSDNLNVRVSSIDATNINILVKDLDNAVVTADTHDFYWECKVR